MLDNNIPEFNPPHTNPIGYGISFCLDGQRDLVIAYFDSEAERDYQLAQIDTYVRSGISLIHLGCVDSGRV